jgi:hypothetical protein
MMAAKLRVRHLVWPLASAAKQSDEALAKTRRRRPRRCGRQAVATR